MSHARTTATKRRRQRPSSTILPGTRLIVDDGQRRCVEHDKIWYPTESEAAGNLARLRRDKSHEPGLGVFHCTSSAGWHLGH